MLKFLNRVSINNVVVLYQILFFLRQIVVPSYILFLIMAMTIKVNTYIVFMYIIFLYIIARSTYYFQKFIDFKIWEEMDFLFVDNFYNKLLNKKPERIRDTFLLRLWIQHNLINIFINRLSEAISNIQSVNIKNHNILVEKYMLLCYAYAFTYDYQNFKLIYMQFSTLKKTKRTLEVEKYILMIEDLFFNRKNCKIIKRGNFVLSEIEYNYFSGINAMNNGDIINASKYFINIKNEREDLYYVQEAKKYLVELNSN